MQRLSVERGIITVLLERVDGSKVYINGTVKGVTLSELEVANMELQAENQLLALKQSELEVTLMEKGVL